MGRTVLVADDDRDILDIVTMSLEASGYDVYRAENGRDAVELARKHVPDLILMDMMMPEMSGYEAIEAVKADPATAAIPIVGLSAKAMATDIELASDIGVDGYITKPFRIAQVVSVIESYF
jgi:CheY-like chemotaxis protein